MFQIQRIAKIDHKIALMSTNWGRSQIVPKNAVKLENNSAKNTNNNSEVC